MVSINTRKCQQVVMAAGLRRNPINGIGNSSKLDIVADGVSRKQLQRAIKWAPELKIVSPKQNKLGLVKETHQYIVENYADILDKFSNDPDKENRTLTVQEALDFVNYAFKVQSNFDSTVNKNQFGYQLLDSLQTMNSAFIHSGLFDEELAHELNSTVLPAAVDLFIEGEVELPKVKAKIMPVATPKIKRFDSHDAIQLYNFASASKELENDEVKLNRTLENNAYSLMSEKLGQDLKEPKQNIQIQVNNIHELKALVRLSHGDNTESLSSRAINIDLDFEIGEKELNTLYDLRIQNDKVSIKVGKKYYKPVLEALAQRGEIVQDGVGFSPNLIAVNHDYSNISTEEFATEKNIQKILEDNAYSMIMEKIQGQKEIKLQVNDFYELKAIVKLSQDEYEQPLLAKNLNLDLNFEIGEKELDTLYGMRIQSENVTISVDQKYAKLVEKALDKREERTDEVYILRKLQTFNPNTNFIPLSEANAKELHELENLKMSLLQGISEGEAVELPSDEMLLNHIRKNKEPVKIVVPKDFTPNIIPENNEFDTMSIAELNALKDNFEGTKLESLETSLELKKSQKLDFITKNYKKIVPEIENNLQKIIGDKASDTAIKNIVAKYVHAQVLGFSSFGNLDLGTLNDNEFSLYLENQNSLEVALNQASLNLAKDKGISIDLYLTDLSKDINHKNAIQNRFEKLENLSEKPALQLMEFKLSQEKDITSGFNNQVNKESLSAKYIDLAIQPNVKASDQYSSTKKVRSIC